MKQEGQFDVVALGELLIDFTQYGTSEQGNPLFEANPGGAPCNVLAMLGRLGHSTAFIGKVGKDSFGHLLEQALLETGISARALSFDEKVPTTLAFVHKLANGDRDFSFYRNPGADVMLQPEDVPEELIENCKIFHFGTLSMTRPEALEATKKAVSVAEKARKLISFDPNLRFPLWDSMDELRVAVEFGFSHCQILKISDNEIQWFTGCENIEEGLGKIRAQYKIPLVLASLGTDGSRAYYQDKTAFAAAYLNPNTVDTTGAGDTFCGCCLNAVLNHGLDGWTEAELEQMLRFANGAASLVTAHKGALRVMPSLEEIQDHIR